MSCDGRILTETLLSIHLLRRCSNKKTPVIDVAGSPANESIYSDDLILL